MQLNDVVWALLRSGGTKGGKIYLEGQGEYFITPVSHTIIPSFSIINLQTKSP